MGGAGRRGSPTLGAGVGASPPAPPPAPPAGALLLAIADERFGEAQRGGGLLVLLVALEERRSCGLNAAARSPLNERFRCRPAPAAGTLGADARRCSGGRGGASAGDRRTGGVVARRAAADDGDASDVWRRNFCGVAVLFAGETVLGASSAGTRSTLRRVGGAAGDAVAGAGCGRGGVGDASSSSTADAAAPARRPPQIDERKGGEADEDADDEAYDCDG